MPLVELIFLLGVVNVLPAHADFLEVDSNSRLMIAEPRCGNPLPHFIPHREHGGVAMLAATLFLSNLRPKSLRVVVVAREIASPELFLVRSSAIAACGADSARQLGVSVARLLGRLEGAVGGGDQVPGRRSGALLHNHARAGNGFKLIAGEIRQHMLGPARTKRDVRFENLLQELLLLSSSAPFRARSSAWRCSASRGCGLSFPGSWNRCLNRSGR